MRQEILQEKGTGCLEIVVRLFSLTAYFPNQVSYQYIQYRNSLVAQQVNNLPAMQETWVQFLGRKDSPEKGMATHSSIAWRIQWTEEPGRLQSMGSQELDMTQRLTTKAPQCIYASAILSIRPPLSPSPGFSSWLSGKESACQCRKHKFNPWVGKDPLEEETAASSSVLAWKTPWTEKLGGLQSIPSQRAGHD